MSAALAIQNDFYIPGRMDLSRQRAHYIFLPERRSYSGRNAELLKDLEITFSTSRRLPSEGMRQRNNFKVAASNQMRRRHSLRRPGRKRPAAIKLPDNAMRDGPPAPEFTIPPTPRQQSLIPAGPSPVRQRVPNEYRILGLVGTSALTPAAIAIHNAMETVRRLAYEVPVPSARRPEPALPWGWRHLLEPEVA